MKKTYEYLRGVIFLVSSICAPVLGAQTLLEWDFGGRGTGSPATQNANVVGDDMESSTLSLGSGLSIANGSNSFYALDYPAAGTVLSDAITGDDYFSFTAEAVTGMVMSLTDLDFTLRRASSATAQLFQWQYSLDGFSTSGINLGSEINLSGSTAVVPFEISLEGISDLQSVASVEFRLYGYDRATASNGSGGFSGNDAIILSGSMTVVPESSAFAGLISMAVFVCTIIRRRRS
ncbi:MAG: hypothetical protein ACQKBT_04830 [Puniceicoccales bacterium]